MIDTRELKKKDVFRDSNFDIKILFDKSRLEAKNSFLFYCELFLYTIEKYLTILNI